MWQLVVMTSSHLRFSYKYEENLQRGLSTSGQYPTKGTTVRILHGVFIFIVHPTRAVLRHQTLYFSLKWPQSSPESPRIRHSSFLEWKEKTSVVTLSLWTKNKWKKFNSLFWIMKCSFREYSAWCKILSFRNNAPRY